MEKKEHTVAFCVDMGYNNCKKLEKVGEVMGRTILCNSCKSTFDEDVLKKRNSENECPVCGASLLGESSDHEETPVEKTTYYYYKEGGGMLDDTLSSKFTPLYTFEAVDMEDAERQLKEVYPNSPLFQSNTTPQIRCPRCFSTEFQLVPRKFSLLTGFATNRYDRVCNKCGKRF